MSFGEVRAFGTPGWREPLGEMLGVGVAALAPKKL